MRVAEKAGISTSVHGLHQTGIVGPFTERRKLLLAVSAFAACNLEADHDSVAFLEVLDIWADLGGARQSQ